MNIKDIENILKDYKRKKSIVEIGRDRIKAWEYTLSNPDMIDGVCKYTQENDCWIRKFIGGGANTKSLVEKEVMENEKEKNYKEDIKQFIREEESRIFLMDLEVKHIEKALKSLTKEEKFIVECKYFEKMTWIDIEDNVNEKFRSYDNRITNEALKKNKTKILGKLIDVLDNFYEVPKAS